MKPDLSLLSAVQAAEAIRSGRITSEAMVTACLKRVETDEPVLKAWAHIDPDQVLAQARAADALRKAGRPTGALHGVPVALKDIVETADMPTQCGTAIHAGRQTDRDARMVERLREAGAVIMGKTATTELAYLHPSETTNPHDPMRTPAGSSSGSAAAVAARHVPLAVGSQTGGSVVRPASFCGVYGFKPTRGTISRSGVLQTSVSLDQMGCFANTVADIALMTDVLGCYDQSDPASFARPRGQMLASAQSEPPAQPDLAWIEMPYHDRLDDDAREGNLAVLEALGARVERMPASPQLSGLTDVHKLIYDYEISRDMAPVAAEHPGQLSTEMMDAIERGAAISDAQYQDALEVKTSAEAYFKAFFNDYDAVIAPSATGQALPLTAGSTGDAIYCTVWTLAGLPCLSMPLLVGIDGLPIGMQLIGAAEEDDRLMRTAAWLERTLAAENPEEDN